MIDRKLSALVLVVFGACTIGEAGDFRPPQPNDAGSIDEQSDASLKGEDSVAAAPDAAAQETDAGEEPVDHTDVSETDRTDETAVCARWNDDRKDLSEGAWTGSVQGCNAGDFGGDARNRALKQINLYRFLAGQPPVKTDPGNNASAQECALMMYANSALNHTPPDSWVCHSESGDQSAGKSNLASKRAVGSIAAYMVDRGHASTMGHRRWLLSNDIGAVGIGSAERYSCVQVVGTGTSGDAPWVAYPGPGIFPLEAIRSIDETGWTVQGDDVDLANATVTVEESGTNLALEVESLHGRYGSNSAVRFAPDGWSSEAGKTYTVKVVPVEDAPFSYEVSMTACE